MVPASLLRFIASLSCRHLTQPPLSPRQRPARQSGSTAERPQGRAARPISPCLLPSLAWRQALRIACPCGRAHVLSTSLLRLVVSFPARHSSPCLLPSLAWRQALRVACPCGPAHALPTSLLRLVASHQPPPSPSHHPADTQPPSHHRPRHHPATTASPAGVRE